MKNLIDVDCPHCGKTSRMERPADFDGRYADCPGCGERLVYQRSSEGVQSWTVADAPCCSDPDCRETEMSFGDED